MKDKLLTTREVSVILGISEAEIINLAESSFIPHFKIGGKFLRFKKEDILKIKPAIKKKYRLPENQRQGFDKMQDFLYFNDFYIASSVVIILLLWIIIKDIAF